MIPSCFGIDNDRDQREPDEIEIAEQQEAEAEQEARRAAGSRDSHAGNSVCSGNSETAVSPVEPPF